MKFALLPAVAFLLLATLAAAVRPEIEQARIDFLIAQVRTSGATFIRNGESFDADKAASHLVRKLDHAGKKIQTAGEFISSIASGSSQTGKPYLIRTSAGQDVLAKDWFTAKLASFDANAGKQK